MSGLRKNEAGQFFEVFAFADAGHATLDAGEPVTGDAANISAQLSLDNAALAATNDLAPSEVDATNAAGAYRFTATQAETNADEIKIYPKSSTAGVQVIGVPGVHYTVALADYKATGFAVPGSEMNLADNAITAAKIASGALTAVKFAAGAFDAVWTVATRTLSAFGFGVTVTTNNDKTNYSLSAAAQAALVAAIEAELADDATGMAIKQAIIDKLIENLPSLDDLTLAAIADAVWDEVITGANHNVQNSAAKFLREASSAIGLTGTAQAGGANTITLAADASASDNLYRWEQVQIIEGTGAGQARLIESYVGATKVATVNRAWDVQPDATSIYSIAGADVQVDHIDAQALAQINAEVDTALADYAPNTTTPPTAAAIADQVWDEATAGHQTAGTTGLALTNATAPTAGAVADAVWDEAQSGHVTAGTFGAYLDAAISGVGGAAGSGADSVTLTIKDGSNNLIADCGVWITSDSDGSTVVAGTLFTDDNGAVTFLLDAGTTYYRWAKKSGYNFTNPFEFVAVAD